MNLILASQSPRRKELLGVLNIPFSIRVPQADETMDEKDDPARQVGLVSRRKALAAQCRKDEVIVAADTIVVCDGKILGKPRDEEDACRMLKMLSGKVHQVMTGLTVLHNDTAVTCTEITDVHFRALSDGEIRRYVASNEPMDNTAVSIWNKRIQCPWQDKAGGYGIQDPFGMKVVERINGDYYNVVGLPVSRLFQLLNEFGFDF